MQTMLCNACTHENRPQSFFCSQCGTKLHQTRERLGSLVRMNGSQQDRRMDIVSVPSLLGRSASANLTFEEESVSKQHARLSQEGGTLHLEDLDSSNGTFINGKRVRAKVEVKSGDLLRLGSVILKFED